MTLIVKVKDPEKNKKYGDTKGYEIPISMLYYVIRKRIGFRNVKSIRFKKRFGKKKEKSK